MDVEAGKDDLSVEDGRLVVFTALSCHIQFGLTDRFRRKPHQRGRNESQIILKDACGALRPGRLTFILGPSGAGKTTLMQILAGRKKTGVSGFLCGSSRETVLVAQQATLIDTLTGQETLEFAAALKLPELHRKDRRYAVWSDLKNNTKRKAARVRNNKGAAMTMKDLTNLENRILALIAPETVQNIKDGIKIQNVSKQLGIQEALKTRACYMSGGERKRLNIACELLTDPMVMLLDEPTSGLDSVSSMSVVRVLRSVARGGRTVACVIHQPSSKLYASADDVILLAEGRTLYAGAVEDALDTFGRAQFVCPQYYNMADYLLEVASGEHVGNLSQLEVEAKSYAYEMKKIAKNYVIDRNGKVPTPESEALLQSSKVQQNEGYSANTFQQLRALLWRCSIGALRDVYLTQTRLACHLVVALLLGSLYNGAGADGGRVTTNTACLFFFLLFLFFSNAMPTIHTFPAEASVVLQEHLNGWYSLPTYCISKILADLPIQILCATVFVIPAWILTSQIMEVERIVLMWVICVLLTILAQTFGLVVGAACGVKLGLFVVPAANIPMLMFSEFFIPYKEMPAYLRPFATISYFRYAFDAAIQIVYSFERPRLPCHQVYCIFRDPEKYLNHLGLSTLFQHDIYALVTWIVLLQISLVVVLWFKMYRACR